jgi:hypothetical protein
MIGEEVAELEDEGFDPLQATANPLAGRNTLVFLSGSSSEEGQGVNSAVVRISRSPQWTQPLLSSGRTLIGLGVS